MRNPETVLENLKSHELRQTTSTKGYIELSIILHSIYWRISGPIRNLAT